MRVAMLAGLPARRSIHVALDSVEVAGKQIKVRLDAEHARKLAELAAERHVEEVELAGELLAAALEDFGMDGAQMTEILDSIPGAWERTQEGLEQARRGETIPLSDL
jgi:hypothetical protein